MSDVTLRPAPDPRIPIWIGGISRKARARAARFDGWFADTASPTEMSTTPDEFARMLEGYTFGDVAVMGYSNAGDSLHREYERRWRDVVDRADPRPARRRGRDAREGRRGPVA